MDHLSTSLTRQYQQPTQLKLRRILFQSHVRSIYRSITETLAAVSTCLLSLCWNAREARRCCHIKDVNSLSRVPLTLGPRTNAFDSFSPWHVTIMFTEKHEEVYEMTSGSEMTGSNTRRVYHQRRGDILKSILTSFLNPRGTLTRAIEARINGTV